MYTVVYDEETLHNLEKLEKKTRKRIFEKISLNKRKSISLF